MLRLIYFLFLVLLVRAVVPSHRVVVLRLAAPDLHATDLREAVRIVALVVVHQLAMGALYLEVRFEGQRLFTFDPIIFLIFCLLFKVY